MWLLWLITAPVRRAVHRVACSCLAPASTMRCRVCSLVRARERSVTGCARGPRPRVTRLAVGRCLRGPGHASAPGRTRAAVAAATPRRASDTSAGGELSDCIAHRRCTAGSPQHKLPGDMQKMHCCKASPAPGFQGLISSTNPLQRTFTDLQVVSQRDQRVSASLERSHPTSLFLDHCRVIKRCQ
jgi:hypothetical protein